MEPCPEPLIELNGVVKVFKNAAGTFTVLKGIDACFGAGEFASIVGRSGSGKSTLLNMITGIDHPTSGEVRVSRTRLHSMDEGTLSVWRGKQMGIVFQFFQLLPMLTLLENVMLPMDFCDMYAPAERETRALELLALVDLQGLENKYPAAVSGGQQQSAAVARALANDPPILIADEPTGNLDSKTAERVLEIFEQQKAAGKTVLMVTHDSTLAARAERILIISDGELVNEQISAALPFAPHAGLLALSKGVRPQTLAAGERLRVGNGAAALVIVTGGALAAGSLTTRWGRPAAQDLLRPGSAWSSEDARQTRKAELRAVEPSTVLIADSLPDTPEFTEALANAAQERKPR